MALSSGRRAKQYEDYLQLSGMTGDEEVILMAKVIESGLPKRAGGHRVEEYPYDEWFTGSTFLLMQGSPEDALDPNNDEVDYSSSHTTMRSSLGGAAKRRGMKVSTRRFPADSTEETQQGLYVQATPDPRLNVSQNGNAPRDAPVEDAAPVENAEVPAPGTGPPVIAQV